MNYEIWNVILRYHPSICVEGMSRLRETQETHVPGSRFKFQASYISGRFETHLTPNFVDVLDFLRK
jgi:hypothetical protein